MAGTRSLHVRCATWEQVEVFYARKLRRGNTLSMKVPFPVAPGTKMTLGLELPNETVIAIDGVVERAHAVDDGARTWIELNLTALTEELLGRLRDLVASGESDEPEIEVIGGQAPSMPMVSESADGTAPLLDDELPEIPMTPSRIVESLAEDEKVVFATLSDELKRLKHAGAHEVLGLEPDAEPDEIRRGWLDAMQNFHPDVIARHRTPALTQLAMELTIHANRAYERLRAAVVREGRGNAMGAGLFSPKGWLIGFEELSTDEIKAPPSDDHSDLLSSGVAHALDDPRTSRQMTVPPSVGEPTATSAAGDGGDFERQSRQLLSAGDNTGAREVLAAGLCVFPRSRPLRALYYVATALTALDAGQVVLATSQLENAIAHHEGCNEALKILDEIRRNRGTDFRAIQRVFL